MAWSPVDDLLTFAAAGHDTRGDDLRSDVWVCKPDGTDVRSVTTGGLSVGSPHFTPDGSSIVFLGSTIGPDNLNAVVAQHVAVDRAGAPAATRRASPTRRRTTSRTATAAWS